MTGGCPVPCGPCPQPVAVYCVLRAPNPFGSPASSSGPRTTAQRQGPRTRSPGARERKGGPSRGEGPGQACGPQDRISLSTVRAFGHKAAPRDLLKLRGAVALSRCQCVCTPTTHAPAHPVLGPPTVTATMPGPGSLPFRSRLMALQGNPSHRHWVDPTRTS